MIFLSLHEKRKIILIILYLIIINRFQDYENRLEQHRMQESKWAIKQKTTNIP